MSRTYLPIYLVQRTQVMSWRSEKIQIPIPHQTSLTISTKYIIVKLWIYQSILAELLDTQIPRILIYYFSIL